MKNSSGKIYILGHFGGYNTGDEAMLGGFLSLIPLERQVIIKYKNGVNVDWGPNVKLFHGSYRSFVKSVGLGDTLVLCGGTHFHDDYSTFRLFRHWLYLIRINYLFSIAKKQKAKTLCIGNGFGPLNQEITRNLTRSFIKFNDIVTVRDKSSFQLLTKLGSTPDLGHPDLATLLYSPNQSILKQNIIGVSLTSLMSQKVKSISDDELTQTVAKELSSFARVASDVLIRLFVIRSGNRESDSTIMVNLHHRLQQNNIRSEIYEFNNDLNALIDQLKPCKVLIASRFHSAVLGSVTSNQLIILSYHKKLISFAEEVGLNEQFVVNLQKKEVLQQLNGLDKVVLKLYKAETLNYNFPEQEILLLNEKLRAFI